MTPAIFRERLNQALDGKRQIAALSRRSGYNPSYIRRLLKGEKPNPTIACVAALSEALNVTPQWLLGLDGKR